MPLARPIPTPVVPEAQPIVESEPVVEDDDLVFVPAPDPSVLLRKKPSAASASTRRVITVKRTIIPLLLVNSLALPALGGLWFLADPDEPIRSTGTGLPYALMATGTVTAALAIWHMVGVRRLMARSAK